jgi:8-oxo-dGTP diphosphatase
MKKREDFHLDQDLRESVRVGVIVLTPQEVLLIERFKNNRRYWVFPGGHKRRGEKLVETAVRELTEETNIKSEEKELTRILDYLNSHSQEREVFYLLKLKKALSAKIVGEEKIKNSSANSYQPVWYPLKNLAEIKNSLYSIEARDWLVNYSPPLG